MSLFLGKIHYWLFNKIVWFENLEEKIIQIAKEETGVELSHSESLKESGLDSLSLVELVISIEAAFGFSFSEDDLQPESIETLDDLIKITEKYL